MTPTTTTIMYFKGWEIYVAIFLNVRVMTVVFRIQLESNKELYRRGKG